MTLIEFHLLSRKEQETVIFENSKFLLVTTKNGLKHGLYAKDKFFIEVVCNQDSLVVMKVTPFRYGKYLDKYSKLIAAEMDFREYF